MATWMAHLRVADRLLDCLKGITQTEFIVGNIAPDSGLPNEDWTAYTPDSRVSHFRVNRDGEPKEIDVQGFVNQYFRKDQRQNYTREEFSFFLGYFTHLLTDQEWSRRIYRPAIGRHLEAFGGDKYKLTWALKGDWYDLDFLYLKKHPDFRAFHIYETAEGFVNSYMDIFARDAFDDRRVYITGFYRAGRENLEREYPYLTEGQMDAFVESCVEAVLQRLRDEVEEVDLRVGLSQEELK